MRSRRASEAAFASEAALLPDIQPDPTLRQRILEAVARAIEDESIELAPLAMIGRGQMGRPRTAAHARFGGNGLPGDSPIARKRICFPGTPSDFRYSYAAFARRADSGRLCSSVPSSDA